MNKLLKCPHCQTENPELQVQAMYTAKASSFSEVYYGIVRYVECPLNYQHDIEWYSNYLWCNHCSQGVYFNKDMQLARYIDKMHEHEKVKTKNTLNNLINSMDKKELATILDEIKKEKGGFKI